MMKKFIVVFTLTALFASSAHADITWAFVGPLTGSQATYGIMAVLGAEQAAADINQAGGINGQHIIVKSYDDACDPKQAVAIANRIIAENITMVIQGDCSGSSIAAAKVFLEEGVLIINTLATNPKLTDEGGPTLFRAVYRDDNAASALSQIILTRFAGKKLAIVHDKGAYGYGLAEGVRSLVNKGGVKEVLFDSYDPNSQDFSALVARLKQANTEVLFIGGYPVQIGMIARQLQEAHFKAQIVAGDLANDDFGKIAGAAGEGAMFIFMPDPHKNSAQGMAQLRRELEKNGKAYNGYTFYTYAAAQVLAQAIQSSGTAPAKIAADIHHNTFHTILGEWRFDQKGDVENSPIVPYRWHNGKYEEVEK
jgi:branched-chain amino acid transport system substrate-binding protein